MTSLFTPSKKRPRYSLPLHSASVDGDGQFASALPHTLPRPTTNGRYASNGAATSLTSIPRSPLSTLAQPFPPSPPPTAPATPATPATSDGTSLLPSTSYFTTPISSSSSFTLLASHTPTTLAVHSLLSERSSRTTDSQLALLSAQLTAQHSEQLTALRYQHNTDKIEWQRQAADKEKHLRVELATLKWSAEERDRKDDENSAAQRAEAEERERRESGYRERIDELQAKLTFVAMAEQKRRAEHERLQDERREEVARNEEERDRERREVRDMRAQLDLLKDKEAQWEQKSADEVKMLRTEASVLKKRVKEKEDTEQRQSERVKELEAEVRRREEEERRRDEEDRKREEREAEIGGLHASLHARMEEAQEVDRRYRQVVEEVKVLRAQLTNQQLLEEQMRGLETKVRRVEADRDVLQKVAMERDSQIQRQDAAMADIGAIVGPVHSVEQVLVAVRALNSTHQSLSQQLAALHTQLTQQTDELTTKQSQATTQQQRIDTMEAELARANQRIATLSLERDSLNKLLQSYDDEAGQQDSNHALRVNTLEDNLARERKEKERLTEEVRAIKAECMRVRKEKEQLEAEIATVQQQQTANGSEQDEYGVDVKIMHLADNPERQKRVELVRGLEEQVERLTERNAQLEADQQHTAAATTAVTHASTVPFTPSLSPIPHTATPYTHTQSTTHTATSSSTAATIAHLEHLLTQKQHELSEQQAMSDKRYERLQSAFRDKAKEFRDGVYHLCGWRMEQLKSGEWRLRSMYGERDGDVLLFVRDTEGRLRLQETELAVRLGKELLSVLTEWQSVPAFTASVTMELLARSTRAS